jgi:ABC-type uncharacterized transport system involved in gliding motility auxiliary subunit
MKPEWRRFAPIGLYVALVALLFSAGLYIVQRQWNTLLQISLGITIVGLAAFAALDPTRLRMLFTGRRARYGSNALILTFAFLGILVVVNYLGYANSQRWDLTEDKANTLSQETLDVLTSLSGPVIAKAFYTPNISSANAEDLLDQYAFNSDGKFEYEFIDPVQDPGAAEEAGIMNDGTIVLYLGDSKESVTTISETEITSALVRLMNPGGRTVYFLTGHGEPSIEGGSDSSYTELVTRLEAKNYTIKTLNLFAETQIPADANLIVIAGPQQPVSVAEVTLIDAYLKNGGALIVMEEPPVLTGFGDAVDPLANYLADNYGVILGNDVVVDLDAAQMIDQPFIAIAAAYGNHAITQKMADLATFFLTSRSVTITETASSSISQVELIQTTERSWAETDLASFLDGSLQPDAGIDPMGPLTIGVVAEDLTSGAKVVVFGDSEFPTNANISIYGNGDMMVNSIDWAVGQENLISLSPGTTTERTLNLSSPYLMGFVTLGSLVIIPGLVLIGGIVAWVMRRRRG